MCPSRQSEKNGSAILIHSVIVVIGMVIDADSYRDRNGSGRTCLMRP
jgi:hypothetical protein